MLNRDDLSYDFSPEELTHILSVLEKEEADIISDRRGLADYEKNRVVLLAVANLLDGGEKK